MGLIACPVAGKAKSMLICQAFIAGAPRKAEGYVFYGVNDTNEALWRKALRSGKPAYYIDNSYFDSVRGAQFRVANRRFQIDAMTPTTDGKRFDALGLEIAPMRFTPDGHWVLIEQSPSFMRTVGAPEWFHRTLLWAEGTGRKVITRRWSGDKARLAGSLQADLQGAWGLLTHTSAAAVTALLMGAPCNVEREHALARMRLSTDNSVDDRRHAFGVLADHQFTTDEMKEGLAWAKVGS